jgi:uncharacterized protein (TIGR02186 family)
MIKSRIVIFLVFGVLILNLAVSGDASALVTVQTNDDRVKIDFFYHGSAIKLSGLSNPVDADLVIKVSSLEETQRLRKKVKAAGLFWMNGGELKFEHSPSVYLLYSTGKLDDILSREEMDRYVIGYPALSRHVDITPVANQDEKTTFFNQFVNFKESSHLYAMSPEKIARTVKDGKQHYSFELNWPYEAPPDNYLVTVYEIKNKKVIGKAEANIVVKQVGIVKTLCNMASNNGALYGVLAVMVALTAGFIVAVVFPKKAKVAH